MECIVEVKEEGRKCRIFVEDDEWNWGSVKKWMKGEVEERQSVNKEDKMGEKVVRKVKDLWEWGERRGV